MKPSTASALTMRQPYSWTIIGSLSTPPADDGEERRKAIGLIDGKLYTVVYTLRGSVCRLISARRSNAKESRSYGYHSQDA
jgi:uncharacterized DUF497 family protein